MSTDPETGPKGKGPRRVHKDRPRWLGDLATLGIVFGLLAAVYVLPADTSLSQLERVGRLTACMPDSYPPLVTGDPAQPGFDVELLREVANRLGLSFGVNYNRAMAQDFNPRSWRVTRAQCQVLAGGIVLSNTTLSFLDATPPYLTTGWAVITPAPLASLDGQPVAFYAGITGLDRISLSSQLRAAGAQIAIVSTLAQFEAGLADGTYAAGVTESLRARQVATDRGWPVSWLSEREGDLPLGIGLWKGDLTLKRAIVGTLEDLEQEGFIAALYEKYDIPPIETVFGAPDPA
ncbi:transporter substrate-binding domain-containing protein [Arsenicitalea aurantiaca]|uniref:Transporter substrate-binding domain-containing protein n=1 Tax=Arsenicitalea aurantiaca TaxID=1783274 RepID=A0A433XAD3_9HYPH|nr:transporter substrate-binding domain-containing protein [Arsenicitalea aurantiaca]RUT31057.1 transporter substrate-binding domain-containing protein [Arsenicitalea aurantiaca]